MRPDTRHPVWWMILFGFVRHGLSILGTYLVTRGIIDSTTQERLVSEGATQVVGWIIIVIPFVWSWLQKRQAWGWVKTALHLTSTTKPSDVITAAPGPDRPI